MRPTKRTFVLAFVAIAALAGIPGATARSSEKIDGKALYKQNCKVCHEKGSPKGEFTPMTLIQDQWKSFFKDKLVPTHKDLTLPGQDVKLLDALTPDQLQAIEKFCVDHAADSEQPQTCS